MPSGKPLETANKAAVRIYNEGVRATESDADPDAALLTALALAFAFTARLLGLTLKEARAGVAIAWDTVDPDAAEFAEEDPGLNLSPKEEEQN